MGAKISIKLRAWRFLDFHLRRLFEAPHEWMKKRHVDKLVTGIPHLIIYTFFRVMRTNTTYNTYYGLSLDLISLSKMKSSLSIPKSVRRLQKRQSNTLN